MAKKRHHPPNEAEFVQLIEAYAPANPHIENIQRVVLKCGPRTYKMASILHIRDAETGQRQNSAEEPVTARIRREMKCTFTTDIDERN